MEVWKDIDGYEGIYMVSSLGRVKSLVRKNWNGKSFWYSKEIIMRPIHTKEGYLKSTLNKENKKDQKLIHRLVAIHFIPNLDNKPQVNHINGIKDDNRFENLEWVNSSENQNHALKIGLAKSKLNVIQAKKIKYDLNNSSIYCIAKLYNVSKVTIHNIRSGKFWKHI